MISNKKYTWKDFLIHCQQVERATPVDIAETDKERQLRIERAKKDYKFFFEYYLPNYARIKDPITKAYIYTECSWFHILVAQMLLLNPTFKGVLEWFRGSAKSVHATLGYPLWLMINGELKTMLLIGQNEDKANKLLSSIQAQLRSNQRFIRDFGQQVKHGSWEKGEFITQNNVSFNAIGLGQSPRGSRNDEFRPDYIVGDDLDTKELCKNPKRVDEMVDYMAEDVMGCFDTGYERFLLVNNRFSDNSILGKTVDAHFTDSHKLNFKQLKQQLKQFHIAAELLASVDGSAYHLSINNDWHWLKVDACDDNFTPTWWQKYTAAYWTKKCVGMPMRSWYREYRNKPINEGKIFKKDWIHWAVMPRYKDFEYLVAYCDPSYKNTKNSDHKAIKLWGKVGTKLYLIKSFVRKCSLKTMVEYYYDLHESLPKEVVCDYYMEANFLQDLLLDEFVEEGDIRGYQLPIRPDHRSKPDKFSRIEATSPLYERGHVIYNVAEKDNPDMQRAIEHLIAFEQGSTTPDDSMDADEGAIHLLQTTQRLSRVQRRVGKRKSKAY